MYQQINLYHALPPKVNVVCKSTWIVWIWFGLLIVLGVIYVIGCGLKYYQEHQLQAIQSQPIVLIPTLANLEDAIAKKTQLIQKVAQQKQHAQQGFSHYLEGLANQSVSGLWLNKIQIEKDQGFTLSGSALRADLVPLFIQQLSHEKAFNGVKFKLFTLSKPKSAMNKNDVQKIVDFTLRTAPEGKT